MARRAISGAHPTMDRVVRTKNRPGVRVRPSNGPARALSEWWRSRRPAPGPLPSQSLRIDAFEISRGDFHGRNASWRKRDGRADGWLLGALRALGRRSPGGLLPGDDSLPNARRSALHGAAVRVQDRGQAGLLRGGRDDLGT